MHSGDQTANLIELPNNGYAPSNAAIARHLREQADWIDDPNAAPLRTVMLIIGYADGDLQRQTCGQPCDLARAVGLLTVAAARMAVGAI